jgi:hypothetical protein
VLFKFWTGFLTILGFDGPDHVKSSVMFFYMLSLGVLVFTPRVKAFLKRREPADPKKYTKDEVATILLERIETVMHLREDALFEVQQVKLNVLRDQMDYAENALDASKNDMLKAYGRVIDARTESREIAIDSRTRTRNMQMYSFILDKIYYTVLSETRRAFRNNGFDEMNDLEFDVYIKKITEVCLSKGETTARQHYIEHVMAISYDDGKSAVDPSKIFEQTADVFKKARRITVKANARMKDIESAYREKAKELMNFSHKEA